GAQKLLADYGDLETILARAAEITAKRTREALLGQVDNARLSKELVTIKRDVPVELDVNDLVLREPDRDALIRILTELEFFSLARRRGASGGGGGSDAAPPPATAAPAPAREDDGSYREPASESGAGNEGQAATATLPATAAAWHALDDEQPLEVTVLDDP